jgi:hypothetical protein
MDEYSGWIQSDGISEIPSNLALLSEIFAPFPRPTLSQSQPHHWTMYIILNLCLRVGILCRSKDIQRSDWMAIGLRKSQRSLLESLDVHSVFPVSRYDSEKRISFQMKGPDFYVFSSGYQFPRFSCHYPSISGIYAIAIWWFSYWWRRGHGHGPTRS